MTENVTPAQDPDPRCGTWTVTVKPSGSYEIPVRAADRAGAVRAAEETLRRLRREGGHPLVTSLVASLAPESVADPDGEDQLVMGRCGYSDAAAAEPETVLTLLHLETVLTLLHLTDAHHDLGFEDLEPQEIAREQATLDALDALTDDERRSLSNWAMASHLRAGDHDDVEVPPKPTKLLERVRRAAEGVTRG